MGGVLSTTRELLQSGKFSDLTLVCNGQEFRVHKAIVCLQSPVIAAALESKSKEEEADIMEVDFDLTALECMLYSMYAGDYREQPAKHVRLLQLAHPAQSVQPNPSDGDEQHAQSTQPTEHEEKPTTTTVSEALIYHLRVNSIANYYGVKRLAKLSAIRIMDLLDKDWSADTFCNLIKETTGDENLRKVIVHAAAEHLSELTSKGIFSEGEIANDIAAEVLEVSVKDPVKKADLRKEIMEGENRDSREGPWQNRRRFVEKAQVCGPVIQQGI
ncbi:hypothetical protein F4680DRAFT_467329 [Xylaria scruposa]|nr:hypothetical protein F4680DRAFT_467329 [Xylaria scruposa]